LKCENDNVILKRMLQEKGGGAVLMVDGGGSLSAALMGDLIAEIGRKNHWAGIVIHGAVRDTLALAIIDFGVKALGSNPRKSRKNGEGQPNVEISFGTITVKPGDWVYCDEDGIVVANRELPLAHAQESAH
jgi:regulator of ribonuclease activity A